MAFSDEAAGEEVMTRDEAARIVHEQTSNRPLMRDDYYWLTDVLCALKVLELEALSPGQGYNVLHNEYGADVISRARNAADAPYNQATCERYPWAAAARIRYLESVLGICRTAIGSVK